MPSTIFSLKNIQAVRQIRAGSKIGRVCKTFQTNKESIEILATVFRHVPDDILAQVDRALSDNEKLRRLIAGLGLPYSADIRAQDSHSRMTEATASPKV